MFGIQSLLDDVTKGIGPAASKLLPASLSSMFSPTIMGALALLVLLPFVSMFLLPLLSIGGAVMHSAAVVRSAERAAAPAAAPAAAAPQSVAGNAVLEIAARYVGVPYVSGGTTLSMKLAWWYSQHSGSIAPLTGSRASRCCNCSS